MKSYKFRKQPAKFANMLELTEYAACLTSNPLLDKHARDAEFIHALQIQDYLCPSCGSVIGVSKSWCSLICSRCLWRVTLYSFTDMMYFVDFYLTFKKCRHENAVEVLNKKICLRCGEWL